ncbi:hypothetical protein AH06_181 [Erwinia phage AH06]|nr:hypothetical protein AH06_181 [Erwinia phage AH06]
MLNNYWSKAMGKSLADLVKAISTGYTTEIEKARFNGLSPKTLHIRTLRLSADRIIDSKKS